jgi:DNA-binding IclR family transcriptional regulator
MNCLVLDPKTVCVEASGSAAASLSISGPNFRLTDQKIKNYKTWVLAASAEISKKLGYNGKR